MESQLFKLASQCFFVLLSLLTYGSKAAPSSKKPSFRSPNSEVATQKDSKLLTVFSWNMLNFGAKKGNHLKEINTEINKLRAEKEIPALDQIDVWQRLAVEFKNADFIALQEVNSQNFKPALKYFRESLQKFEKDETLCMGFSNIPSDDEEQNKTELERFAFVWRDSRVSYVKTDGTVMKSCKDNPNGEIIFPILKNVKKDMGRMPAYGTFVFTPSGKRFHYVTVHLRPKTKNPHLEVPALAATFAPLADPKVTPPGDPSFFRSKRFPVFISGDFNMSNAKQIGRTKKDKYFAFQPLLDQGFEPALDKMQTSLKKDERILNEAYDNFWYRSGEEARIKLISSNVHNLYEVFPDFVVDKEKKINEVVLHISDHCPIEAQFEFIDSP